MYITASSGGAASLALSTLQKTANGEYTAGSVAMNPHEALRMLLTRQEDGNYAAPTSPMARTYDASEADTSLSLSAMARSTDSVRFAVNSLTLGG